MVTKVEADIYVSRVVSFTFTLRSSFRRDKTGEFDIDANMKGNWIFEAIK